ncbi:family 78 glycoside hydrolase catalytic domain [Robinsoniella peoriensis]|uniref:alpha-L-rhamnosidase-related protein n=1 Tax=Robinsoniella peoriensis TaxID=180332 RepID=UPI0005C7B69C|nr:family 78 glycoside hydrolase catalytic domain [Robinsoniella peoriensis]
MFKNAKWIGVPKQELQRCNILQGEQNNRFAYFYLDIPLKETGVLKICLSAAARYRMWVNGHSILSGPCKGDRYRQYYDEIMVSKYLRTGTNRIAIQVLACDSYIVNNRMKTGTQPLIAYAGLPLGHRLAVQGGIFNAKEEKIADITTGIADWRVRLEGSYQLEFQEPYLTWFGAIAERIPKTAVPFSWKKAESRIEFQRAEMLEPVQTDDGNAGFGNIGALVMKEREIPLLYETENTFQKELLEQVIPGDIHIGKNTRREFILDAGEIKTAFVKYAFSSGKDAKVSFTYAERFMGGQVDVRRDDYINGTLDGMQDEIFLDGTELLYEPFWYRTFRFIKIVIETGDNEVYFREPHFMETGYPIEVQTWVDSSNSWVKEVWEICVNTLKRCMNETYMDCPYYEQMQFPMDTRLQALYTYICSNDTRLAKKAIKDFHYSIIPDGLVQGKYPCSHTQIISTFSLHYIFMLKEYYIQTGDRETIRRYRPDVDLILDYYDRKIKNGLVENLGYWEFVDWQPEWEAQNGSPEATAYGASTIINLMYSYALSCGADINEETGRCGVAAEYRNRQRSICDAVEKLCWSEKRKLYREGPEFEQYSVHAQAWAVLNKMKEGRLAGELMERALAGTGVVSYSFSTSFELLEALALAGKYELAKSIFKQWQDLKGKGCTTCPEVPVNSRSDCHAWSAQPIYELIHHILGIQIEEPGWKKISIKPHLSFVSDLKGELITPMGILRFQMEKKQGAIRGEIFVPMGMEASYTDGEGAVIPLNMGESNEIIVDGHQIREESKA